MLVCPHCTQVYLWHRLKGQKRAGWSKEYSAVELIVFPHFCQVSEMA
jgi:hypothetical protein